MLQELFNSVVVKRETKTKRVGLIKRKRENANPNIQREN
jgi:hypothetical protein